MRDLLKKLQSDPTWSLSKEDQEVSCSHTVLNKTNIKIPYEIAEVSENSPESGIVKINLPDLEIETISSAMKVDKLVSFISKLSLFEYHKFLDHRTGDLFKSIDRVNSESYLITIDIELASVSASKEPNVFFDRLDSDSQTLTIDIELKSYPASEEPISFFESSAHRSPQKSLNIILETNGMLGDYYWYVYETTVVCVKSSSEIHKNNSFYIPSISYLLEEFEAHYSVEYASKHGKKCLVMKNI